MQSFVNFNNTCCVPFEFLCQYVVLQKAEVAAKSLQNVSSP